MNTHTLRRMGALVATATATAVVFTTALWVQHTRAGWPFEPEIERVAPVGLALVSDEGRAATHDRVPVDVSAATIQNLDIRLEVVGRESLTQHVRAVAIVVPDESRISHVH